MVGRITSGNNNKWEIIKVGIRIERASKPTHARLWPVAAPHHGTDALEQLDTAHNYNAWLGRKLRTHLGSRILEVGAGIGTITRQIAAGREKVVALEVEPAYVEKLRVTFAGTNVTPLLASVETADWASLAAHRFDTVVLSNVLEHIEDDLGAVSNFGRVLQPGGRLVVLVPALPLLYGSLDEAVGHHRRYTRETLTAVLTSGGFAVEHLEWLNLFSMLGWFVNGRIFKRRTVSPAQLALYDRVAPLLAALEDRLHVPIGMSLLAVGRR